MKLKNSPWKNNETKKNCNKKIEVLSLKKNEKGENLLHVTTINHSFKKANINGHVHFDWRPKIWLTNAFFDWLISL